jgi:hypothetical protein
MPGTRTPRIIFVPGKNPKPAADVHRAQLWRCLLEGVRRARPAVHADMQAHPEAFSVVAWNFSYYGCERPADADTLSIDAVIRQPAATDEDRREARQWRHRLMRFLYLVADLFPALIPLVPDPKMKATVAETLRYFDNRDGVAELVRRPMEQMFHEVCRLDVPFMIIGHSLGSVIAWDALWKLSHEVTVGCRVDLLLTIGSPLGTRFVQRRLLGHTADGAQRYPTNIRRWKNITAVGDLTAVDPRVRNDFRDMIRLGLVEDIRDNRDPVYNFYRSDGELNVHRSYGYLVNAAVGAVIAQWWEEQKKAVMQRG